MKHKVRYVILSIIALLFVLTGCQSKNSSAPEPSAVKAKLSKTTPTFFLHGWGSSINAEKQMTNAAKKAGVTNTIITVIVDKSGKVKIDGDIPENAQNPIIMVGFENNKNIDFKQDATYAYDAITTVSKKYGFKKMNLVAHSMGNMAIMYLLLDYGNKQDLPKLQKQVDIAGHFNGINGMDNMYPMSNSPLDSQGKPLRMSKEYKEFMKLRQTYPKNAEVLNIFGDVQDGTKSDGPVPVVSARSLRYLVSPRAKSYQELLIKGKMGQHSQLHENKQVDKAIIRFLWNK